MTSSFEQSPGAKGRARSTNTRQRLLKAAAEVLAEVGWGRVTTRAVADRARLPLGTVSYHFRGKQELLRQAALTTVEDIFPLTRLSNIDTLQELVSMMRRAIDNSEAFDPVQSGVLMETMRESGRDPALRKRMIALLADYRRLLSGLMAAEQQQGALAADADPSTLATLVAALGDGLLLHAMVDQDIDAGTALETLLALLTNAVPDSMSGHEKA